MKSNLLKSSILFVTLLILMMAATATANAMTNDTEISCDLIDNSRTHDCQLPAGTVVAVYQAGENDCLAEIINAITGDTLENSFTQSNYIVLVLITSQESNDIADAMGTSTVSVASVTTSAPEPPTQTALPVQQTISTTASLTAATTLNTPLQPQNQVEIITRAELSGNPLHGASFTVYKADDNQRVGEATTDESGKASISLTQGEYYMRNDSVQYGYLREQSRIFFIVGASGDVIAEITIQRDASTSDVEEGGVTVPKTGELAPILNYMLSTIFLMLAVFCGIGLLNQRKRNSHKRKEALAYA